MLHDQHVVAISRFAASAESVRLGVPIGRSCSVQKYSTTRRTRRGPGGSPAPATADLSSGLAGLIMSIKPHALCDSCIALDVHVSHADAHDAAVNAAAGEAFQRTLRRCHRCGRTVEATSTR
jgi:hypothetical protein